LGEQAFPLSQKIASTWNLSISFTFHTSCLSNWNVWF